MLLEKSAKEFIDTEYKEYSMYVLQQRAIPSCIDGLKPVQRKLLYSMLKKGGKKVKIAELGGSLSSCGYHHGEASAMGTAVNMACSWDNNAPLFEGHGNFGSRIIQEAAAPRYIFATLSDNYKKFFCDEEVLQYRNEEDSPEPCYYLPVIPWALVNGSKGIAVGFATNILPRSPERLAKACREYMEGKKISPRHLVPVFPDFKGTVELVQGNQWKVSGVVSEEKGLVYRITELPIGWDRQSYIEFLNKLLDTDKIQDYEDLCSEKGFEFEIKVNRAQKQKIEQDANKYFKMDTTFTENLTTLDEHGNLKVFDTAVDLVKYFCDFRVKKTQQYLDFKMDELQEKIKYLKQKQQFIKAVIADKIDLKKSKKSDVEQWIENNITDDTERIKAFVGISFYEFTQDAVEALDQKIKVENANYVSLTMVTAEQLYIKRLQ
jgi:DNA gyrase/topoisomerase IV subunit A